MKILGIGTTFLTGNHDAEISDHHHLDLADGKIFLTHGDVFYPTISPWGRTAARFTRELEEIAAAFDEDPAGNLEAHLERTRRARSILVPIPPRRSQLPVIGKLWTTFVEAWPPTRTLQIIDAWRQGPALGLRSVQAYRPDARFVIWGHLHCPHIAEGAGRVSINTGSFTTFTGRQMVELHADRLEVFGLRLTSRGWEKPEQPKTVFALD